LLEFANHYKKLGYECNLVFASTTGGRNGYGISDIQFDEIYDLKYFSVFDTIITIPKAITDNNYGEYTYHGPDSVGLGGWNVFFNHKVDHLFKPIRHNDLKGFSRNEILPHILPKFNKVVYDKVNKFKELNPQIDSAIQLRLYGYGDKENHNEKLTKMYSDLYKSVKNSNRNFFLTSSCISCLGDVIKLPNVFLFGSRNTEENFGDVNFDLIDGREKQLDTLYNFISEMVMIGKTDFVYYYSIHWPSTYLYYAFANNENITITHINDLK
jgi:hypothetical protein